jgi:ABC-type nickel/cobalt efflux system permease component RcnA
MLELLLSSVGGLLVGGFSVWMYYRNKFTEVLTELEDKKLIIKAIHEHADQIERVNVKKMAKEHNAKVAKKEKVAKKTTESPKRKYKKQSV